MLISRPASFSLLLLGSLVLGQQPTCFQPRSSPDTDPPAADLVSFVAQNVNQACDFLGGPSNATNPLVFNATGYVFAKINFDALPGNQSECISAFSAIESNCILGSAFFGGQWSPNLALSYLLTNLAYPANPILNAKPPPSTSVAATTPIITTGPTTLPGNTGVTTSQSTSVGGGGGTNADVGREITEVVLAASAAAAFLLAVSWLGPAAEIEATAALAAVRTARGVIQNAATKLPVTPKLNQLTGAIEAANFAAVAAEVLPNPIAAASLTASLLTAVGLAAEVAAEAAEEPASTATSSGTSSSSSSAPTATPYLVSVDSKWPSIIVDAFIQAFPDDGKGDLHTFEFVKVTIYLTNITEFLAGAISILPVFDFIIPNEIPAAELNNVRKLPAPEDTRRSAKVISYPQELSNPSNDSFQIHDLEFPLHSFQKRLLTPFPLLNPDATLVAEGDNTPNHLARICQKDTNGWPKTHNGKPYYLRDSRDGEGAVIYVLDSGFGNQGALTRIPDEFANVYKNKFIALPVEFKYQFCGDGPADDIYFDPPEGNDVMIDSRDGGLGHGTCVASVAAGLLNGAAKKATLIPVRQAQESCSIQAEGFIWLADAILEDAESRKDASAFILNLSLDWEFNDAFEIALKSMLQKLFAANFIVVVAAGQGQRDVRVDTRLPQQLGPLNNDNMPIITVGGVLEDGSISGIAYQDTAGEYISVYGEYKAQCVHADFTPYQTDGTSVAAPVVAGVLATWLVVPEVKAAIDILDGPFLATKVRNFLRSVSLPAKNADFNWANYLYNGFGDNPCRWKNPEQETTVKKRAFEWARELFFKRQSNSDTFNVVVDGTLVDPNFTPAISECPLRSSSSSTSSEETSKPTESTSVSQPTTVPTTSRSLTTVTPISSFSSTITSIPSSSKPSSSSRSSTSSVVICNPQMTCDNCQGSYNANSNVAVCRAGQFQGCVCAPTNNTCGSPKSCSLNGCAGTYLPNSNTAQCSQNFKGCTCTPDAATCGKAEPCDINGCQGTYDSDSNTARCRNNFKNCVCTPTAATCGKPQSCDSSGCQGTFDPNSNTARCRNNFKNCICTPTDLTCGRPQPCDSNGCQGTYDPNSNIARCRNNFRNCVCLPTAATCGKPQPCNSNGCNGTFDPDSDTARCRNNFKNCICTPTAATCGKAQSCDAGGCAGTYDANSNTARCRRNFANCVCIPTANTCGNPQPCDTNGCAGTFDANSNTARCRNNFRNCVCKATASTCGMPQPCDSNGCAGTYDANSNTARCRRNFANCVCNPTPKTCGSPQSCDAGGCNGQFDVNSGQATCRGNFRGCPCKATSHTCGLRQSCQSNGCAGTVDHHSPLVATCKAKFKGCECVASAATPGFCGPLGPCSFSGCNGSPVAGSNLGRCTNGCECVPNKPPPPPPQTPTGPLGCLTIPGCAGGPVTPPPNPFGCDPSVNVGSLTCNHDCCGFIPCPGWCNANCGGIIPQCR